jgi:hypothetical protein
MTYPFYNPREAGGPTLEAMLVGRWPLVEEILADLRRQATSASRQHWLLRGPRALFIASVIMLLGTLARTQREAGVYTAPLTFVAIFLAVFSMSSSEFSLGTYAVPILGNSLAMRETLLDSLSPATLLLAVACNLLLFAALVWLSVRLYHREEVLFRP